MLNSDDIHYCHWPECKTPVEPRFWGCKIHWYMLPKHIRQEIWRTYRPGQEVDKRPSADYLVAALRAQAWIHDYIKGRTGNA